MSYLKSKPIRSKKLRDSARDQPCTLRLPGCDGGGETTVLCHLPHGGHGMGRKAPDYHAVFACHNCHDILDGRKDMRHAFIDPEEAPLVYWQSVMRAHAETMQIWADDGLIAIKGAA